MLKAVSFLPKANIARTPEPANRTAGALAARPSYGGSPRKTCRHPEQHCPNSATPINNTDDGWTDKTHLPSACCLVLDRQITENEPYRQDNGDCCKV